MSEPTAPSTNDRYIAALLRERAGYVARGLKDRIAGVDEQLRQRGHTPPAAATDAALGKGTGAGDAPKGRSSTPPRVTTGD